MGSLAIELVSSKARCSVKDFTLSAIYTNTTNQPLALAFWWNRSMRILDGQGQIVVPGPGVVLPCGVSERWQIVMPGHKVQRAEPLSCTQPAGQSPTIGWSYKLAPGSYRITLVFEAPPAHGFSQSEPSDHAFRGRVESRAVSVELPDPPDQNRHTCQSRTRGSLGFGIFEPWDAPARPISPARPLH